jgi:hypothetical protein
MQMETHHLQHGLMQMPFTKLFKDTVKERIERDPAFAAALFEEALSAFLEGDTALGKSLLRDLISG